MHKITILPRGRALGYTMVLPDEDKYSQTRAELLDKLAYMMGGRAAEELVFHNPTTGAGNDIEKATKLARAMVTQYGMTERLGAVRLGENESQPFLGRDIGHARNYSEAVAAIVDEEINKLIIAGPPGGLRHPHREPRRARRPRRASCSRGRRSTRPRSPRSSSRCAGAQIRPAWTGSDTRIPSTVPPVESSTNGRSPRSAW